MSVSFSVIIASKNGEKTLPKVFKALGQCAFERHAVEFLLVDNGSTDSTGALFEDFMAKHRGEVLSEERPGKSNALNLALGKASGEIIAFLDDDAIPSKEWFSAWEQAAAQHPNAGVFVGAVSPLFLDPPPAWLRQLTQRGMSCACTPEGMRAGPCSPSYAKGLNWALRRSAVGNDLFDVERNNLVHAGKAVGGQDTEMARRIAVKGYETVFVPSASAAHIVRPHEMTLDALFKRYQRIGRGVAAQGHKATVSPLQLKTEMMILRALSRMGWLFGQEEFAALCHARVAMRSGRLDMMSQ